MEGERVPLVIESCPVCTGALTAQELHCRQCNLTLQGEFVPPGQARPPAPPSLPPLSDEQAVFLRLFVRSRGNLTEIERTLGVSYPTVRAKLDDLIGAIDASPPAPAQTAQFPSPAFSAPPASDQPAGRPVPSAPSAAPAPPQSRHEVLTRIASGQLSAAEGLALLKTLSTRQPQGGDPQ